MNERMEKLATGYLATRPQAALTLGLLQNGQYRIRGYAGTNAVKTPDAKTIYEVGSITKVFTAIVLAKLVADGRVRLEDSIHQYLPPEVKAPEEYGGESVTLLRLAIHTAGLPRLPDNVDAATLNSANPYRHYHAKDLYRWLEGKPVVRQPGTKYEYSNVGYALLGHLLELRAGQPYETLVKETLCDPLNLKDTVIRLSPEQQDRLVPGHDPRGRPVPNWEFDVMAPAGAFRSTAGDLLRFAAAHFVDDDSDVSKLLKRCREPRLQNQDRGMGLGWQLQMSNPRKPIVWHNGGTAGYASFLGLDCFSKVAVVALANYGDAMANDYSLDKIALELLQSAVNRSP